MATKKQQKRRYQQAKAHARGRDLADPEAPRVEKKQSSAARSRGGRVPQQPNPLKAAQKAGVFAALFFLVEHFTGLGGKSSPAAQAIFAVWMFAMFWVIGMWTERYQWRRYLKQQGQAGS